MDEGKPGAIAKVIRRNPKTGQREFGDLVWGLLPCRTERPTTAVRPIHARAETVQELPMFADAFRSRRAIVPATEYYIRTEKDGRPQRYVVTRADGKPMAWAGLWESFVWPGDRVERSYCVITVDANATIAPHHDRMPLILEPADWPVWLGEAPGDPATLLRIVDPDVIRCEPVAQRRGSR